MDKQTIKIDYKKPVKVDFNDQEILVTPYIDINTQIMLIDNYIQMYFDKGNIATNLVGAEYALILGLLDNNTNIKIDAENIDINQIVGSGLWDLVKDRILNYQELRNLLGVVCRQIKDNIALEKSVGHSIDKIGNYVQNIVEKIDSVDFSEEGFKRLADAMSSQVKEYKDIVEPEPIVKKTRKKALPKE